MRVWLWDHLCVARLSLTIGLLAPNSQNSLLCISRKLASTAVPEDVCVCFSPVAPCPLYKCNWGVAGGWDAFVLFSIKQRPCREELHCGGLAPLCKREAGSFCYPPVSLSCSIFSLTEVHFPFRIQKISATPRTLLQSLKGEKINLLVCSSRGSRSQLCPWEPTSSQCSPLLIWNSKVCPSILDCYYN